jgi:hypothetical protein
MQAGHTAAPVQTPAPLALNLSSAPPHYLRRLARMVVLRAALRGRLSWPAALLTLQWLEAGR